MQHQPKAGKPSYGETSSWIGSKLPSFGTLYKLQSSPRAISASRYEFISMADCVLRFRKIEVYNASFKGRPFSATTEFAVPLDDFDQFSAPLNDLEMLTLTNEQRSNYVYPFTINNKHKSITFRGTDTDGGNSGGSQELVGFDYIPDYDTKELMGRWQKAYVHAASLCQVAPTKQKEPF